MSPEPSPASQPKARADLVDLNRYRQSMLGRIGALEPIRLALLEAHGSVLAEPVVAQRDVPAYGQALREGYALRSTDTYPGAQLTVTADISSTGSPAQAGSTQLGPGQAVRVSVGSPLPPGADCVLGSEAVESSGARLRLRAGAAAGAGVRRPGEEFAAGETVIEAGRRLKSADVGLLTGMGLTELPVHPRPRVVVLSAHDGDPGREPGAAEVTAAMVTAMAREAGAAAYRQSITLDDRRRIQEAFEGALTQADLLLVTTGRQLEHVDAVRQVLSHLGDVRFTRVGVQPATNQAFGFLGTVPCFGLFGRPISAYVSFEVFVRPTLRRMQRLEELNRPKLRASLEEGLSATPTNKVWFVPVKLRFEEGLWYARLLRRQGEETVRSLIEADGLAEVPAELGQMWENEKVTVHLLVNTD